jgi:UPF0755 protein
VINSYLAKISASRREIVYGLAALLIIVVMLALFWWQRYAIASGRPFIVPETVRIFPGMTVSTAADSLAAHGVISNADDFRVYARFFSGGTTIRFGNYAFKQPVSIRRAYRRLAAGQSDLVRLTIPEGERLNRVLLLLSRRAGYPYTTLDSLASDSAFCASLGVPAASLEGYILPETYFLNPLYPASSTLRQLVQPALRIYARYGREIHQRQLSIRQVATLASLVEGEAQHDNERGLIASVYYNRLARNMRLQADPTIQYLIEDGPRRLRNRDLQIDSPYNTYKYRGLPPGPINNPGKASIMAAIFPDSSAYLYFVARGDGGHYFATTYQQHLRNKARFDAVRREVARRQRSHGG